MLPVTLDREKSEARKTMNKDKAVAVAIDTPHGGDGRGNNADKPDPDDPSLRPFRFSARNASSKYDFVKVKVWLGDNADHYYVLSRFLLSRMLTVTKLMERRGYGQEYINRYKLMTRFHHQRVPLVILVCGTACTGKSTIATQLAQRLNLPNVLQTDMVYELLRTSTDAPLTSTPVWAREFCSSEEFITEFCRECRIVRKGLAGDLKKAMKDGKPVIIEGIHLDPSIYLMDDENKSSTNQQLKVQESKIPTERSADNPIECADDHKPECESTSLCPEISGSEKLTSLDQINEILCSSASTNVENEVSDDKGGTLEEQKTLEIPQIKKERSGAEPIIVPIALKMAEFDHEALLEEWIPTRTFSDNSILKDKDKLIKNLKIIQDYLCSFESQGLTVVNISATTFPQTLDWLHNHLLQCIELGTSSVHTSNQKDELKV